LVGLKKLHITALKKQIGEKAVIANMEENSNFSPWSGKSKTPLKQFDLELLDD